MSHGKTLLAAATAVLVNTALVLPPTLSGLHAAHFAHLALELPVIAALLWAVPRRLAGRTATVVAVALVLALLLKLAALGIDIAFGRMLDVGVDLRLVPAGFDLLSRSHGPAIAVTAVAGAALALLAFGVLIRGGLLSLAAVPPRPRTAAAVALAATVGLALLPLGSAVTTRTLVAETRTAAASFAATAAFRTALAEDPLRTVPGDRLYAALKGHDVLVVFVESYGRVAVEGGDYAGVIGPQLDAATAHLAAAGFASRSAWLLSPTFGGESWFAHSTVMSGLWVNDQRRYDTLVRSRRPTMIGDFHRAGWRTVAVMPEITMGWPEAAYFGHDAVYDAPALGYRGQPFAYVTMADQFTLARFAERELVAAARPDVMAEIALISSHAPWTPLPKPVPWEAVGDGTVFDTAREGDPPTEVWADPEAVRLQYGRSIAYVLATLESFVLHYGSARTVMIVLGDHQPMAFISGEDAPRTVPVHVIARDPAVIAALDAWHWTDGMHPAVDAPVGRMDELRERLARAFSEAP